MYSKMISFVALITILLCTQVTTQAQDAPYRVGIVPQFEARRLHATWKPILKELSERTGLSFTMVGTSDIPSFEKAFLNGEYDFAYMNPYHAMLAFRDHNYTGVVRDGGRELFGVLVKKKGSPIKNVADLDGKEIAFPAPNALGASLLMRRDLDKDFGIRFTPLYSQTHSSVYLNVVLGKVAAGGGVMGSLAQQKQDLRDQLEIIYETRKLPPHPLVAHKRVPQEHVDLVRKALLDMTSSKEGAELLKKIPILKAIPAVDSDYEILSELGLENYWVD